MGNTNMGMLGMQAAGNAVDSLFGIALAGYNDKRQLKQQEKLQRLQIEGNKEMGDYNFQKQYEMWLKTGYEGQMQQMIKAGLNPGLLYGMGGAGGQSTGSPGAGISGANAPVGGGEIMGMMNKGNILKHAKELEVMEAQKQNIEADTANKEAENPNIPKQGTLIDTQIKDLSAGIKNKEAQEEIQKIQLSILEVEEHIAKQTQNIQISTIQSAMTSAYEKMKLLENERKISDQTVTEKIEMIKTELAGMYLENNLKKVLASKGAAEIAKITHDIITDWKKIGLENRKLDIEEYKAGMQKYQQTWDISQEDIKAVQGMVNDILQAIIVGGIMKGGSGHKPVKGFRY